MSLQPITVQLTRAELGEVMLARYDEFVEFAEKSMEAQRQLLEYVLNDPEDTEGVHDGLAANLEGWRARANALQARVEELVAVLDKADT